jgi:ATP/maltotriose-dependent transcriptional regulator MalT
LAHLQGHTRQSEELYRRAWLRFEADDHRDEELAANIGEWYGTLLVADGRASEAVEWVRRALVTMTVGSKHPRWAMFVLPVALACRGDTAQALEVLAAIPEDANAAGPLDMTQLIARGLARLWSEERQGAVPDLRRAGDLARQLAIGPYLAVAAAHLSDAEYRLGDWDASILHGEVGASAMDDADQVFWSGPAHAVAASAFVARGQWEQAEQHIEMAERVAALSGALDTLAYAATARARLELTRGQPAKAIGALEPLVATTAEPLQEPGILGWRLLLAEALILTGDYGRAQEVLDQARERIELRRLAPLRVVVARLQGEIQARTGYLDEALQTFAAGLAVADPGVGPFECAQLELAYGSWLRRQGRRRAAKEQLERARERLLRLRAQPLLERCEAELAGAGLKPARRTPDERNRLTAQELAVARLVADGLTNRAVASQLVISRKTVEYHLDNVYTKLAISSRTQLAGYFLQGARREAFSLQEAGRSAASAGLPST